MLERQTYKKPNSGSTGISTITAVKPLNVTIDPLFAAQLSIDTLLINKTIFVDSLNGNDTTAIDNGVYNSYFPFQNILTAKAYAASGDMIYIRKGTYTQKTINNSICSYFLETGAIVQNTINNNVFAQSNGVTLNIFGNGTLRSSVVNSAVIVAINNTTINVQCYKIIKDTNFLGMAILCITGGKIYCDCYEIDCRFNGVIGVQILDANGFIQLNAQILRYSFIAALLGNTNNNTSKIIYNVSETIVYDMPFVTAFNGTGAGFVNNGSGEIVMNTRFSSAQTTDSAGFLSSIGLLWNNGANVCNLYINSPGYNKVRLSNLFRTGNITTNGKMVINGNFKNDQSSYGVLNVGGTIDISGKIENEAITLLSPIEQQAGTLIINDLITIAGAGSTYSISSPAAQNIRIYKHVTNKGYNSLITDIIPGSLNIINANVI